MIKAHHGFWHRNSIRAVLLVSALAGIPLSGLAQGFPGFMATVTGRTTTISAASNGTLIATKGSGLTAGSGWYNAGNYGVAPGASGAVKIGGTGTVAVGGKQVPVEIGGSLSKDVLAGAISGCLSGSIAGCVIGAATPFALQWMAQAGTRLNDQTQQPEIMREGQACATYCYEYQTDTGPWSASASEACSSTPDSEPRPGYYQLRNHRYDSESTCRADQYWGGAGEKRGEVLIAIRSRTATNQSGGTWYPATPQEVKDALIAKGAPPPRVVPELEKTGVDWAKRWPGFDVGSGTPNGSMTEPNVTGPASLTGDKTTTTNSDGSKTTSQTSTPLTYGPGKATAGPATSTTTTTNADGSTRTSQTTTEPGTEEPAGKEEEDKDKDFCLDHPERIGCLDIDVPEGKIPKETKNVTFTPSELPGISSGQCPADVSMSFASVSGIGARKILDWRAFCDMAIPLRSIVMALASIMAFFIVMPGGRVE